MLKSRLRWIAVASVVCLIGVTAGACSGTSAQDPAGGAGASGRGGGRGGRGGRGAGGGGAQPVVMTKVTQRDVPVDIAAVGNVEAYTSVSVRSQVTGQLQEAFFHEGDIVKKGDKLFAIDPRPLEAALQQAAGQPHARSGAPESGRSAARARRGQRGVSAGARRIVRPRSSSKGIVSKDAGDQARAAADAHCWRRSRPTRPRSRARRRSSRCSSRSSTTPRCSSATRSSASTIDGRTGNNTVKVGNLVHGQQHGARDDRAAPAGLRHVLGAGHAPARRSSTSPRRHDDWPSSRRRRTAIPSRSKASSRSSTTSSTARPTRSS